MKEQVTALPPAPFPSADIRAVRTGKTCFARFDLNAYSVPPDFAGARLTLAADRGEVRVLDGPREIARHPRCYDRDRTVTDPEHARALAARRRRGRSMSVRDRLLRAVPAAGEMLALAGAGGRNVTSCARMLTRMLDECGPGELGIAAAALGRGSPNPETARAILEKRRRERDLPPVSFSDVSGGSADAAPRATGLAVYDRPERHKGKDNSDG